MLVVLGSPNSPEGVLSDIAKSRSDYAAKLYSEGKVILCTGGWGKHFNTSEKAHAVYVKEYLMTKGIPESAFLEPAFSGNTVEDALISKKILSLLEKPQITFITSDYHLERVKLIFGQILKDFAFSCIGVSSEFLGSEERAKLVAHEQSAIQSIIQNGLII